MNRSLLGATLMASLLFVGPAFSASKLTDSQIKAAIIRQSIAAYPGNCPCPYNAASNGSSCGRRSAWSRAGGYAPLCYPSDVTKADVAQYRQNH
ncbi:hypothetical protein [Caulobacter sp. CCG-8]|uniref:hypothetical protein n=1 Tax=Caulobacter sp. CCG-8 TaxID=3127958 RepID=UPI00307E8B20